MNRTIPIVIAALALAGCTAPYATATTPRSITIQGDGGPSNEAKATEMAQQHCREQGLNARMSASLYAPSQMYPGRWMFDCVP